MTQRIQVSGPARQWTEWEACGTFSECPAIQANSFSFFFLRQRGEKKKKKRGEPLPPPSNATYLVAVTSGLILRALRDPDASQIGEP